MSTLNVDKVDPSTGTTLELGSSGDTVNLGAGVTAGTGFYNDDVVQSNIAMLGFKVAVNGSLAKYNLQDQIVDEYEDATGIDAGNSTNIELVSGVYSSPSDYFGGGADGALSTSGDVTHTVTQIGGSSYDGDMVVKEYTSLTINAGHTMTTDQPCRGMVVFVQGDCTISGTLSMKGKGAFADPSSTTSSDGNAVGASGLQFAYETTGGSSSFTNDGTGYNGGGTTVRSAFSNIENPSSNGTIYTVVKVGGTGGAGHSGTGTSEAFAGNAGSVISNGTGGGGGGARRNDGAGSYYSASGTGGTGTCFSGGSGGGSVRSSGGGTTTAGAGGAYGGAGGSGGDGNSVGMGGVGNPGGTTGGGGGLTTASGTGGLLVLIVGGDLLVNSGGTITSMGVGDVSVDSSYNVSGGGSGGGRVIALASGTITNSGTITADGGASPNAGAGQSGGTGGNGGVTTDATLAGVAPSDVILQSSDTTAEAAPTKADMVMLIEDAGSGVGTVNTHIKGWISMYETGGTKTWTQGTLVDEGDWGTNKRILAFHDLTLTGTSGTQMAYKITTHSTSSVYNTKFHATSIGWR